MLLGQANSARSQAKMPAQHRASIFFVDFNFSCNISEIHINLKNV
jgi:hypothetical protein